MLNEVELLDSSYYDAFEEMMYAEGDYLADDLPNSSSPCPHKNEQHTSMSECRIENINDVVSIALSVDNSGWEVLDFQADSATSSSSVTSAGNTVKDDWLFIYDEPTALDDVERTYKEVMCKQRPPSHAESSLNENKGRRQKSSRRQGRTKNRKLVFDNKKKSHEEVMMFPEEEMHSNIDALFEFSGYKGGRPNDTRYLYKGNIRKQKAYTSWDKEGSIDMKLKGRRKTRQMRNTLHKGAY